jgi:hypothetical protein
MIYGAFFFLGQTLVQQILDACYRAKWFRLYWFEKVSESLGLRLRLRLRLRFRFRLRLRQRLRLRLRLKLRLRIRLDLLVLNPKRHL